MSTHVPEFQGLHHFEVARLVNSRIRVKVGHLSSSLQDVQAYNL